MNTPRIPQDDLYQLLRSENVKAFNERVAGGGECQLQGCDFRGLDLRGLNADGLDFTDAYLRGTDLRGIDFRTAKLEGASIIMAKISGCYFPAELAPEEIALSLNHGTRMRYR